MEKATWTELQLARITWTDEKKEKILKLVEHYILKNNVHSGEKVYQDDDCNTEAVNLAADIADVVEAEYEAIL